MMNISPSEKDHIDIHSHLAEKEENVFRILNLFSTDFPSLAADQAISIGLHPWYINDSSMQALPGILDLALNLPTTKAVGETGMDRLIRINMEVQQKVFITHIKYAIEYNRPLIIHCVRTYSELIHLKTQFGSKIPWIIHGFNGNESSAKDMVSNGFYISLGSRFLQKNEKTTGILEYIPIDKIFIETDDNKMPVAEIYGKVAELYKLDISSLQRIIYDNYMTVFNK